VFGVTQRLASHSNRLASECRDGGGRENVIDVRQQTSGQHPADRGVDHSVYARPTSNSAEWAAMSPYRTRSGPQNLRQLALERFGLAKEVAAHIHEGDASLHFGDAVERVGLGGDTRHLGE